MTTERYFDAPVKIYNDSKNNPGFVVSERVLTPDEFAMLKTHDFGDSDKCRVCGVKMDVGITTNCKDQVSKNEALDKENKLFGELKYGLKKTIVSFFEDHGRRCDAGLVDELIDCLIDEVRNCS
jgi:hypothetical protein